MRKFLVIVIALMVVMGGLSTKALAVNKAATINKDNIDYGIVKIGYVSDKNRIIKVMIKKDSNNYIYSLKNDGTQETFSLQMGNGNYNILIFENIQGNTYLPVYNTTVSLNMTDDKKIYLNSIQNINWNVLMMSIKKANDLTKGLKSDDDKIDELYGYMVHNFKYDFDKWKNINSYPNPYIPVIDQTYQDKKGICYDYSALFAAMLRSQNIPAKLIMGYCKNVTSYHAWNEVYLTSTGKWIIVDTTYDSQIYGVSKKTTMSKDSSIYTTSKYY